MDDSFNMKKWIPQAGLAALLALMLALQTTAAFSQILDTDETLPPLVDTSVPAPSSAFSASSSEPAQKLILNAKVQTLQEAIVSEANIVDWYAWYLACREYLSRTGGLQCALGTPIKFHKGGRIEAVTYDPVCLTSLKGRHFDLPKQTALETLILPVRNGYSPPASREEIYSRIEKHEKGK